MILKSKPKTVKIDNSLYNEIAYLQKEIERKTAKPITFRYATELYAKSLRRRKVLVTIGDTTLLLEKNE